MKDRSCGSQTGTAQGDDMRFRAFILINALLLMIPTLGLQVQAQTTESLIYTFSESTNFWPQGGLLEDSSGNLFGTARGGGAYGVGAVFELSPPAVSGGAWTMTTLYSFVPYGSGGYVPVSDLVRDQAGNFYGTYYSGGDPVCQCGGIFKLFPPAVSGGAWTEQSIYSFKSGSADGHLPAFASLALTAKGIIYGVTIRGGAYDAGVLYQLTPSNPTTYKETVLWSFGNAGDGVTPNGGVILDAAGSLYGVTSGGGTFNQGVVYKYVPANLSHGAVESVLYSFGASTVTGSNPSGSLVFDSGGDIYGVTNSGGDANDDGVVYMLAPSNGVYTESILTSFNKKTGTNPVAGLSWNHTNNNLYGTTSSQNGLTMGDGTVFKLTPPAVKGGAWTLVTEYQFTYKVVGGYPTGTVLRDPNTGNLFGTAINGGVVGCDLYCGTVWEISNP
jgi:uncharacterized repeat protein (TIGR03803 family)